MDVLEPELWYRKLKSRVQRNKCSRETQEVNCEHRQNGMPTRSRTLHSESSGVKGIGYTLLKMRALQESLHYPHHHPSPPLNQAPRTFSGNCISPKQDTASSVLERTEGSREKANKHQHFGILS